jgi:hypothetical protein
MLNRSDLIALAQSRGMQMPGAPAAAPRSSAAAVAAKLVLHAAFLVIAVVLFASYLHLKAEGRPDAALACLVAAAIFGFAPLRDLIHIVFRVEGTVLHLVHLVGGIALVALPLTGGVSGAPLLARGAMAPFAIMGAAQALMHQSQPRNAKQAAAMQRFAASLPEVAQFAGTKSFSSPEGARRAVAALSDILTKAQALGETELEADPRFQSALGRASTRFGTNLGLDAVGLTLDRLAANPATASAVPGLRRQLASARQAVAAGANR